MAQNALNSDGAPESNKCCIYDMNDDCLIAIADHLDIFDWLNLYETSIRLRKIILTGIIPRNFIDFKQICGINVGHEHGIVYDAHNIFQRFGKVITRFGICGANINFKRPGNTEFDEFMQLMLDYCTNGAFREVHIEFNPKNAFRSDLLSKTKSYFRNVTQLKVKTTNGHKVFALKQWIQSIIGKYNLQFLELNGVQPFEKDSPYLFCLMRFAFPKLEHLKLKNVKLSIENQTTMNSFLIQMPQIKAFYNEDQTALLFAQHIECIGKLNVVNLFQVTKQLKQSTTNLKCVVLYGELRNYREFDVAFKIFAEKTTLKKMAIEICSNIRSKTVQNDINTFIRQSVRNVQFLDCFHLHCTNVIGGIMRNYIEYLVSKVFQFKTCILSCNKTIYHITVKGIIRNSDKMETLFILDPINIRPSFYKQIVGERKKALAGSVSPKPLIIFIACSWCRKKIFGKDVFKSDIYEPNIVSITIIPKEEMDYF